MKRYSAIKEEMVESKEIDEFIADIEAVCIKHGLSISTNNPYEGLCIEGFSECNIYSLKNAVDKVCPDGIF